MKRLSPGVRFLLGFITFLLSIALFVSAVAGILISNFVNILSSQENLQSLLRQVMFVDLKAPVRAVPGGNAPAAQRVTVKTLAPADIRLAEQQAAASMVDWLYESLIEDFGDELQVSLGTVQDFVERSTLDDFLVEKGAAMLSDVYTGQNTATITPEEIEAKIAENTPLIEEVFGVEIAPQVIADITSIIQDNEYFARIQEEGIVDILFYPNGRPSDPMHNPDSVEAEQIMTVVRNVLSVNTVYLLGGACLLLIILILLVNMKQIWVGMNKAGITLMSAALPSVILTVAVLAIPAGWSQQFGLFSIVEILIRQLVTMNAGICIGVFAVGLVLLIFGIVTKGIVRRSYEKAARTQAISNQVFAEAPVVVEFPTEEEAEEELVEVEEADETM